MKSSGTLVNKDTTSKLTKQKPGGRVCVLRESTNSLELSTDNSLRVRGFNTPARYFDNSYVAVPMKEFELVTFAHEDISAD